MHVVLDLDGTLVKMDTRGKYHAGGDAYAPLHGCNEFLLALGNIPGMEISFFSFGNQSRNKQLVAEIVNDTLSRGGGSAPAFKQYNVFSQDHLDRDGCKRLEFFSTYDDMKQTIMVDDMACSVCAHGEEKNFLPVYSGDFLFEGAGVTYPRAVFHMRRDNSLVRVLGVLLWCLNVSEKNKVSLVEALANLQWNCLSRTYRHRETNSKKIYCMGLEAMRRFTPNFQLLDREQRGFLPWSPPLAELNPGYKTHVILWYQHFGFDEELSFLPHTRMPMEDLRADESKFVSVEVMVGGLCINLPASLSPDATKATVKDIVAYGLDRNFELIQQAPGRFSLVLQRLELCDFDVSART